MYQQCPVAIIAATEQDVLTHGQVMYGLVKPTKDLDQVESTAAMVNVIPKKRTYLMTSQSEMDLFMEELMKRPLVLQPSAYIGQGIAAISCALCTSEEKWVICINQTHPKIISRMKMGINMARAKMDKGEPFILQLSFNEFLTQNYAQYLTQAVLNTTFTFISFEDAEIVVRYPGEKSHRSSMLASAPEIKFTFDDLLPSEITRRTVAKARSEWSSPALRVIPPDELVPLLNGWEFEMIDPLEGAVYPEEGEEEEEEEAVGGIDTATQPLQAPAAEGGGGRGGRILGRAARKAQAAGGQVPATVELHAVSDRDYTDQMASSRYEEINRAVHRNEHEYANRHYSNSGSFPVQRQPQSLESPYEEMNVGRNYDNGRSPRSPRGPQTPNSPSYSPNMSRTPRTPNIPHSPNAPRTPTSGPKTPTGPRGPITPTTRGPPAMHIDTGPRSPASPISPKSPKMPDTPKIPLAHRVQPHIRRSPHSPTDPRDMYNSEAPAIDSRKTYLTDDADDGGFSQRSPRMPQDLKYGNKYDSNYNRNIEVDRYGGQSERGMRYIDPSNRYADSKDNFSRDVSPGRDQSYNDQPPRTPNTQRIERPVPVPRSFHHHQGSGRSDTSASDSGFGEIENGHDPSRNRRDRYNVDAGSTVPTKGPYYNRAFEKDSPEKERDFMDEVMAKHKALAAQMTQQQPHSVPSGYQGSRSPNHDSGDYGRELQKWQHNINTLKDAYNEPTVNFSRSRSHSREMPDEVEESFI